MIFLEEKGLLHTPFLGTAQTQAELQTLLIDWLSDCSTGDWTQDACMLGKHSTTELQP